MVLIEQRIRAGARTEGSGSYKNRLGDISRIVLELYAKTEVWGLFQERRLEGKKAKVWIYCNNRDVELVSTPIGALCPLKYKHFSVAKTSTSFFHVVPYQYKFYL